MLIIIRNKLTNAMRRRRVIKGVGGGITSGLVLGSVGSVKARQTSVEEYESYAEEKLEEHGSVAAHESTEEIKTAIKSSSDVYDPENILGTHRLSSYSDSDYFTAVEEIELQNGQRLEQVVTQEDEDRVSVTLDGEEFVMSMSEVTSTLERRLEESKQKMPDLKPDEQSSLELEPHGVQSTSGGDRVRDSFRTGDSERIRVPAGAYTDYNDAVDRIEAASIAAYATTARCKTHMLTSITSNNFDGMDELTVGFYGNYAASATNALAGSEIEVKCEILDDDGDIVADNTILSRNSFPGDLWSDSDSYSEYIYTPTFPDNSSLHFRVVTETAATAVGPSTAAASTGTDGVRDDYVDLDEWIIKDYHM